MARQRLILDTDIGTDVDDCLALALALKSPELELVAVTVVYGDVLLRARMALKLLAMAGRPEVPVAMGAARPLLGVRPVQWEGHEGQGLLEPADDRVQPQPGHAAELITSLVMADPGQVTLAAIGPLTNLALAFQMEPRLAAALRALVIMGGVVGGPHAPHLPAAEHNFSSDPEAAQAVLSASAPTTIVPLDVTTRVRLGGDDVVCIEAHPDPFRQALADQIRRYPRFQRQGWTYLHDPLAVATLIDPGLVRLQPVQPTVETRGDQGAGRLIARQPPPGAPARSWIAADVDEERAHRLIVDRLAG